MAKCTSCSKKVSCSCSLKINKAGQKVCEKCYNEENK